MTDPTPLRYDVWPTVIVNLDMYVRFQLFIRCPAVRRAEISCPAKIDDLSFNLTSITMGKTNFRLAPRYRLIIVLEDKTRELEFKTRPRFEFEAMKQIAMKLLGRYSKPVIVGKLTLAFRVIQRNSFLPPTLKITSRSLKVTAFGTNSSENVLNDIRRHLTLNSFPLEDLQLDIGFEWTEDPILGTAKNLKLTSNPDTLYGVKNHKVQVNLCSISLFNPITLIEVWRTEKAEVGRHFRLKGFSFDETRWVLDVVKEFPGFVKGTREDNSESSMFPECFILEMSDEKRLSVFGKQYLTEVGYFCYEVHFKLTQILNDIV